MARLDRAIQQARVGAPKSATLLSAERWSRLASERTRRDALLTDSLTNPTVKAAIDALQRGDRAAWSALFERDAQLYDDGSPRDLKNFTADALGHERFTSIAWGRPGLK